MRLLRPLVSVIAFGVAATRPCSAQPVSTGSLAPARQVQLDVSVAGLNAGFAVRTSSRTAIGASIGIGGNWVNYMLLGGRHFAEPSGLAYATKDGSVNKELLELARATIFVSRHFDKGRQVDVGLKAAGFLHFDSSDDDPGGGTFIGLDVTAMWWQRRWLQIGSQLDVGRYSEGRPELGVNVAPALIRVTFR